MKLTKLIPFFAPMFVGFELQADTLLRFCHDPYPPYTIQQGGQSATGLKVNALREVAGMIDELNVQVELIPWKRCQEAVRNGQYDGILPLFVNEERRAYISFTDAVFSQQSVFFYSNKQFPDQLAWSGDFAEIADLKLGMLRGGFIDEEMQTSFEAKGGILRSGSIEGLFRMLQSGRIDLVATDLAVGKYIAAQVGLSEGLSVIKRPISTKESHFGLSKQSGADTHLAAFNSALEALRSKGRLRAILEESP